MPSQLMMEMAVADIQKYSADAAKLGDEIAELEAQGVQFHDFPDRDKWRAAIPDFFTDFINDMDAQGKGDAARKMIGRWKEVTN